MAKIIFMGACETVTGSKYLLEVNNKKILIDCGLFQGIKELRLKNWAPLPVSPKEISSVLLTHAHIDHSGYLPLLAKQGFKGQIMATEGTKDLCEILLPDSGFLQEEEAYRANKYGYSKHHPALPLYTKEDAINVLKQFKTVEFAKSYNILPNVDVSWLPAGHIIGASIIECNINDAKIVFSGDLGKADDPIMYPPTKITEADYLVLESTYGNRLHEKIQPQDEIEDIVNATVRKGGTILIPAFAVGRAQNLLYYIHLLKEKKKIPDIPVFLDSPMSINATNLMIKHSNNHRLSKDLCKIICKTAQYIHTPEESKHIGKLTDPKIIISASGMATGGRILHHIKKFGPDPKNTILFSGYQAIGTRGARILAGEESIKIHGEFINIKAKVYNLSNTSAHPDYAEILDWLGSFKKAPKQVFITHGEKESSISLKEKIEEKYGWKCSVPSYLEEWNIE